MTGLMMGIVNKFILGKDNFLVTGDACGVMHNGGEGISCALATGDIAGKAIIQAENDDEDAIQYYRNGMKEEIDLCLDQFNLLRMGKVLPFHIDMKAVRKEISLKDYYYMYKDFRSYLDQDLGIKEAKIGRIQKRNMYHRLIFKKYPVAF
jgi:flavin-dependent dehydrogenase